MRARSNSHVSTAKRRLDRAGIIILNRLNRGVETRSEQEQTARHDEDMRHRLHAPGSAVEQATLVELPVCNREENEAEERVERRAEQGEEITHGGNDLGEDETDEPNDADDDDPDGPSDECVAVRVAALAHNASIYELCADVGVNDADDDGWYNDKSERRLLVHGASQAAKGWCGRVLAKVLEADRRWDDEQESRNSAQDGKRLGKILGLLHLGDEGREQDLRDPEEGDVEDGVHDSDESSAFERESVGLNRSGLGVDAVVAVQWVVLGSGEDEEEQDRETHACSREHGHERHVVECARQRHDDTHQCCDDGEDDSTQRVVRQRVEDLCASQDVETDQHDVVEQQHDGCELVRDLALAESVVAEVANVHDLGVLHDELVHGH